MKIHVRTPYQPIPDPYYCYVHGRDVTILTVNGTHFCAVCSESLFVNSGVQKIQKFTPPKEITLPAEDPYDAKPPTNADGWIDATEKFPPKDRPVMMRRTGSEQIPQWQWKELPGYEDDNKQRQQGQI